MSKTSRLHKKALFFSVALSAPFLCASLYGSGMPQEMDLELTSKKRPAQDTPGGHINKKPKLDMSGNDLSLALAQPTAVSFDAVPQDVTFYLSFFLNLQDKNHFALVSKATYKAARDALIYTDIRGLKDKEWANGPTKGTFENYLFNSIIWKMGSILLHKANNQKKMSLFKMGPLLEGYAYLQNQCGHLKASQNVLEAFFNMENFRASENGALMAERALSDPKGGEDDFLSLVRYLTPNGETYTLPQDVSTPMGLVERFQRTASAYRDLMNQNLTWQTRASQGDFLLTYDLMPITLDTIQYTANAHYHNGEASKDPSQKLASFARSAEVYDAALDKLGEGATANDIQNVAAAHYNTGGLSEDPSQKLASFIRAAQLYDAMLEKRDEGAKVSDIKCAGFAHHNVGMLSEDPSQKLASFIRAAQLYEAMLNKLGEGAQVNDIGYAANNHVEAGIASNEPSQKIASFTRAAELFEAVLEKQGADATVNDIKCAANMHYKIGEASLEPSQKLASFTRAAQLSDTVLEKQGAGAQVNDIGYAANNHIEAGIASKDPSQKLASFTRAAELFEAVLEKQGTDATVNNIKCTANMHYKVGEASLEPSQKLASFTRAAQLSNTVLEKQGAGASADDVQCAATAHFNAGAVSFEPSQKLVSFKRAAELFNALFTLNPDQPISFFEASIAAHDFIRRAR